MIHDYKIKAFALYFRQKILDLNLDYINLW